MSKIDEWEAEAKNSVRYAQDCPMDEQYIEEKAHKRILALIDLVRKKDEALKYYDFHERDRWGPFQRLEDEAFKKLILENKAAKALALTEELNTAGRTLKEDV